MTFEELGLSPDILKAIDEVGYTTPTPIQAKAIPIVLTGRDVMGCAQTGTGKTAGFTLPMIEMLAKGRARARMPRSLILAPTRELAAQVSENFDTYGKYCNLSMALLIGGSSFTDQERKLDRGVDVLIATPGRLIDLFERGKILLADVKILVIDEADRMLDMGFIPDVERIVGMLPRLRQTLFFSATMAPEIKRLADKFLSNPKEIAVDPPASAAVTVTQAQVRVGGGAKEKRAALRALLRQEEVQSCLIFCNRKRDVDLLYKSLARHGFPASALHGDMPQPLRMETLDRFKRGEVGMLVCSDVAARGLDIPIVSHVFNFDVPIHAEDYVHRIGRTGRAGRSGKAFMLVHAEEARALQGVKEILGRDIPEVEVSGIEGYSDEEAESVGSRRGRRTRKTEPAAKREGPKRGAPKAEAAGRSRAPTPAAEMPRAAESDLSPATLTEEPIEAPLENQPISLDEQKRKRGRSSRKNGEKRPSNTPSQPTNSFGDHTPAFILRPTKVA